MQNEKNKVSLYKFSPNLWNTSITADFHFLQRLFYSRAYHSSGWAMVQSGHFPAQRFSWKPWVFLCCRPAVRWLNSPLFSPPSSFQNGSVNGKPSVAYWQLRPKHEAWNAPVVFSNLSETPWWHMVRDADMALHPNSIHF